MPVSPRPARPGTTHDDSGDTPTVPLTVWPVPVPAGTGEALPRAAADRVLAAYTRHRDTVVTVDGPHQLAEACRAFGRRRTHLASRPGPDGRPRLHLPARPRPGTARLVVDDQTGRPQAAPHAGHATAWYAACLRLLAPGGHLLVVVDDRADQAPADVLADTVKAARAAGLAYLQHVVVLRAPVRDGQLDTTGLPPRSPEATPPAAGHAVRRVHTDIAVFTRPGPTR